MDSSGGRLNTPASIFSYHNSLSNFVSNDNTNEQLNSALFAFDNGIDSSNQFLTPFSPSSFITTYPNQFFDSPSFLFNSNIISTPASGNYIGYDYEEGKINVSDLLSRPQTDPTSIFKNKMEDSTKSQVLDWNNKSQPIHIDFSKDISKIKPEPESLQSPHKDCKLYPTQASKTHSKFEDGYNWRKYGQKQVKGSKKPRGYFKCSYANCPAKKKVEKDLNGYITEIIYKGKHNHPMPHNMNTSLLNASQNTIFDYSIDQSRFESSSHNSFTSFGEDEYDHDSSMSKSGNDCDNETDLPNAKRCKIDEADSEALSYVGSKALQEPKVVIETKSEIDILDDGYKWRKYGQKVVKGNPNPRSYYKCTNVGCPVRKLVERASHDLHSVITTYEAKHNHGVPSRGGDSYCTNQPPKSNTMRTMPETSTCLAHHSYDVQNLEKSNDFGFMETSYLNEDWMRDKLLSKTKEEPENEFIYNSF